MDGMNPLDAAMNERRLELDLEWQAVAKVAGVTYETLRRVRRLQHTTALTERAIERALGWPPHRIRDLRAVLTRPACPDQLLDDFSRLSPERQDHVRTLVSFLLTRSGDDDHSIGASGSTVS